MGPKSASTFSVAMPDEVNATRCLPSMDTLSSAATPTAPGSAAPRAIVSRPEESLSRMIFFGEQVLSEVHVPTKAAEDQRQLHRELHTLKRDRTRVINRIEGYLFNQGIRLQRIRELPFVLQKGLLWNGDPIPDGLRCRIEREWAHFGFLHRQILAIEAERREELLHSRKRSVERIRQPMRSRALGPGSATILVQEFFAWRKFRNGKQVGSLAGLTPTPYQSGETSRERGISNAGNRHVRGIAIQLAWSCLRYQPNSRLSLRYDERFGRGGPGARKVGIVAVARKLLIELWRFPEWGVLPEGAEPKAWNRSIRGKLETKQGGSGSNRSW